MDHRRVDKKIFERKLGGKRRMGRPRLRWLRMLKRILGR
jgi:hypothetical protein